LIELLTPTELDKKKWEGLLNASPHSTFFQTAEWCQVWGESFPFFKSYFLVAIGSDGSYRAGLPYVQAKKLLSGYYSMPMGTYGGAACRPGGSPAGLYRRWLELTTGVKRERLVVFGETEQPGLVELGFSVAPEYVHRLNLPSGGRPLLSRSAEKQVGEALQAGFSFVKVEKQADLKDFYMLTGRGRKKTFYTKKFYEKIAEILLPDEKVAWFLAKKDGKAASFLLCFPFRDELFLWDADFDPKFSKLRPGYFLMTKVMDWAINKSFKRLNFGQSPVDAFGVTLLKERMGAEKVPVYQYTYSSKMVKKLRSVYEKFKK